MQVVHQFIDRVAAEKWINVQYRKRVQRRERREQIAKYGSAPRGPLPLLPELPASVVLNFTHVEAWVQCVAKVDQWMKLHAPNEVAMLVAEDPGKIQNYLKFIHAGYADDEDYHPRAFTTHHIVDTVTFAKKDESILLQIADTCAFVVKRQLMGKEDIRPCFELLNSQLISPLAGGASWSAS